MKKRYVQAMLAGMTAMLAITVPVTNVWAAVPEKEQTVYVNADANGNTEKIIVSNWLKNAGKDSSLEDRSDLTDIQNVKGEETFSKGNDGSLNWKADGNDIYYQGETAKELPVSVKMTYFLDGKETPASQLAGKSGKVKIRIDYTNNSVKDTVVNGKKERICTPFMMATGMILPTDKFTNVEVKNGKVISDGKNEIVMGIGFPGLADSLKLSDLDGMEDKEIPDYVEITADAEDFSLALTATVATTGTLKDLGLDDIDSLDDLEEKMNTLSESSEALVDGSKALMEGIKELNSSADTFVEGLNSADNGAGQLKDGIDTMNNKKVELLDGINQLAAGMTSLNDGAKTLETGVVSYIQGAEQIAAGLEQVDEGAAQLKGGIDELNTKKAELTKGVEELAKGTAQMKNGTEEFQNQLKTYTGSVETLSQGLGQLYEGMSNQLGVFDTLPGKLKELGQGVNRMDSGAKKFEAGASEVQSGAAALAGQMKDLNSGIASAKGCMDMAAGAFSSVQMPDMNAISKNATQQAQAAVNNEMNRINAQANTKQRENVEKALDTAGLTEEQKTAVMGALGNISVSMDTSNVQVSIPKELSVDNSKAQQKLEQAKAGLETVSKELSNAGIDTAAMEKMNAGAKEAVSGAQDMQNGLAVMQQTMQGMADIQNTADMLLKNVKALKDGSEEICGYNKALNKGAEELTAGAAGLDAGAGKLAGGAAQLSDGVSQLAKGADILYAGTNQLKGGSTALIANNFALISGAKQLTKGSGDLLAGGVQLKSGADLLSSGIGQLAAGASELKDGTRQLADGGKALKDGTMQLEDGSVELADGVQRFDEEGIQTLAELVEGDAKDVLNRLKAIVDADEDYTAFDGWSEDGNGTVKFIIETAGIE